MLLSKPHEYWRRRDHTTTEFKKEMWVQMLSHPLEQPLAQLVLLQQMAEPSSLLLNPVLLGYLTFQLRRTPTALSGWAGPGQLIRWVL